MNLRLNQPFQMTAGPRGMTPFSDYLKATYGRPRGTFLYPSLQGLAQDLFAATDATADAASSTAAAGTPGGAPFSCPPNWTPCTSGGENICLYPGNSCGDTPQPTNGPVCQDYDTWTSQVPNQDCVQYCSDNNCNQAEATQCNAYNNQNSIAFGQIQQAFGDCFPPNANINLNQSTGAWTVTQNGAVLASGNTGAGNISYDAAGTAGQNIANLNTSATSVPVSQPIVSQPVVSSTSPTTSIVSSTALPTGQTNTLVQASTPVQQPTGAGEGLYTGTSVSTGATQAVQAATSGTGAPVSAPTSCSGLTVGSTCIDSTTLLIGAGALVALLLLVRR